MSKYLPAQTHVYKYVFSTQKNVVAQFFFLKYMEYLLRRSNY